MRSRRHVFSSFRVFFSLVRRLDVVVSPRDVSFVVVEKTTPVLASLWIVTLNSSSTWREQSRVICGFCLEKKKSRQLGIGRHDESCPPTT